LHTGVEVIDFFTLTCKCNSFLHAGVEVVDEPHPGPRDLSDQGAAPSGGLIGWLRIRRPGTGSTATGVRRVQSRVGAESGEPVEQALGALLRRRQIRPQDTEDGKKTHNFNS
jgi:hypothetical protein